MAYTKPEVIAQNSNAGSYAAGCPTNEKVGAIQCDECERTS